LTGECKCLVAIPGGVRVDADKINKIGAMNEILYDIKRSGRAVRKG
jgi:hypothetical protein